MPSIPSQASSRLLKQKGPAALKGACGAFFMVDGWARQASEHFNEPAFGAVFLLAFWGAMSLVLRVNELFFYDFEGDGLQSHRLLRGDTRPVSDSDWVRTEQICKEDARVQVGA